jgi:ApbE superfamily uncharacterized protein (UPF0280 family)
MSLYSFSRLSKDTDMAYEPRTYRRAVEADDLVSFEVVSRETDLQVLAERDLSARAEDLVAAARGEIESFIERHPGFQESLSPFAVPDDAPVIVRRMAEAAAKACVGPMAAVAGVIAQSVAEGLAEESSQVVVENGGDIYIVGDRERTVGLFAGESRLSGTIGLRISPGLLPLAVCTSSGTVGHSLSFGVADAVTVLARDGALADAVATGLANRVQGPEDIERAVQAARAVMGLLGVLVVVGDSLGAWGNMRLTPLAQAGLPPDMS